MDGATVSMESIGLSEYWRICRPPWLRARYHRGTPSGSGTELFYLFRHIFYHSSRGVWEHNYSVIMAVATLLQQDLYHWPSKMTFEHCYNKLPLPLIHFESAIQTVGQLYNAVTFISQWGCRCLFYYFIFLINLPIISLKLKANVKIIGCFWFMGRPQFRHWSESQSKSIRIRILYRSPGGGVVFAPMLHAK